MKKTLCLLAFGALLALAAELKLGKPLTIKDPLERGNVVSNGREGQTGAGAKRRAPAPTVR